LLLYILSFVASLHFSLASHSSLALGQLLPRIRASSHMLVGALFEGPIDIIGDCICAVFIAITSIIDDYSAEFRARNDDAFSRRCARRSRAFV
jgi:hypothetical protein